VTQARKEALELLRGAGVSIDEFMLGKLGLAE
jgi:hypothetical protein